MSREFNKRDISLTVKGFEIPVTVSYEVLSGPLDATGYYSLRDFTLGVEVFEILDRNGYDITSKLESKYLDVYTDLIETLKGE